ELRARHSLRVPGFFVFQPVNVGMSLSLRTRALTDGNSLLIHRQEELACVGGDEYRGCGGFCGVCRSFWRSRTAFTILARRVHMARPFSANVCRSRHIPITPPEPGNGKHATQLLAFHCGPATGSC